MATSLTGYLVLRLQSYLWGTSELAGAFEVAWSIPFLLITASGLDAIQAVTARFFSTFHQREVDDLSDALSSFLNMFGVVIVVLIALIAIFRQDVVALAAPGFSDEHKMLAENLITLLAPVSLLLGVGMFFGGVYAAKGVPITAEITLLITRIGLIAVVLCVMGFGSTVSPMLFSAIVLCMAVVAAGITYIISARAVGFQYRPTFRFSREIRKNFGSQVVIFILGGLIGQLVFVYFRSRYSLIDSGLVAAFAYAFTATNTFASILGKLAFFSITENTQRLFREGKKKEYLKVLIARGGIYLLISMALCQAMYSYDDEIISLLFEGGAFDISSRQSVKALFDVFIYSVPGAVLIWALKVPSITGRYRLPGPMADVIGWFVLALIVTMPSIQSNAEYMAWALTGSFWMRVIMMSVVVVLQVRNSNVVPI